MNSSRLREALVRGFCRLVAGSLFRIRVLGTQYAPLRGPALLVSNHVTCLDAFVIGACIRPVVKFLVWKPYYDHKLLTWGLRLAKAIPIDDELPCSARAIQAARAELMRGRVVCVFAEGSISRTGILLPFKRGVEAIVKGLDVAVLPVHLGGLWESVFSFEGGRFFWKRPMYLRHPVVVSFGPPMHRSATAAEIREAVLRLAARYFRER
jgi:acyl-[acyl-carrier-protein]-phospholipid O-acyltransferase/long-chain-fatty-acid--[acyl-carrier-protein] ligase